MTTPICKKCGKLPASKDGKRKGVQRYRAVCGRCRWDQRMADFRDERAELYKAAQQSEVKMLAERRLRRELDESLRSWIQEADGRQKIIAAQDAQIASLKDKVTVAEEIEDTACAQLIGAVGENQVLKTDCARLREQNSALANKYRELIASMEAQKADYAVVTAELAKLTADYDSLLPMKWQWMQRAQGAEARVSEQRATMDDLERTIEDWEDRAKIVTAELGQAQSLLKRTKRMVAEGTAENRHLQSRLADADGRLLAEKRIVKARDAEIREMAEARDHAWITAENAGDALKRRIQVLEAQAVSAEDRHVTELGQLQALMDAKVTDREETARRLVSGALILLICLTAAFAAFVGLN